MRIKLCNGAKLLLMSIDKHNFSIYTVLQKTQVVLLIHDRYGILVSLKMLSVILDIVKS